LYLPYTKLRKIAEKNEEHNFQNPESSKKKQIKSNIVSWSVFLFTVSIVFISLISIIFPALIISNTSPINDFEGLGFPVSEVDPLETGTWAIPLIVSNLIIFGTAFVYFKKKIPHSIKHAIDLIFNFEVSKKLTAVIISSLLIIYVIFSAAELATEEIWEDYPEIKDGAQKLSLENFSEFSKFIVKFFFLSSSIYLFDNIRIIPFLASICLLILMYFFTTEISQKRFAGIVSMGILLQSHTFLTYDSTATYENFWVLLYLLSLYMVFKVIPLSPFFYILSILSKTLTVVFLPMTIFFILRTRITRKKKILTFVFYGIAIAMGTILFVSFNPNLLEISTEFNSNRFWQGFTALAYQLRFDGLLLMFLLPLIAGLFIASKKGIIQSESIMVLIAGILLSAPLITGFTENTNQPYRFVPLIVFFAIGVGILLTKRKK